MAKTATGIDVGTATAKMIRGEVKGTSFVVSDFFVAENPSGTLADGWQALGAGFKPGEARVGVTGRDVNMRYTRVPRIPDWQLRKLMRFETEEVSGQSEAESQTKKTPIPRPIKVLTRFLVTRCAPEGAHRNGQDHAKSRS